MASKAISRFQGNYRYLSNFHIEPDGSHVEGEFQRSKCKYAADVPKFKNLLPREAKALGRSVQLRDNWEVLKLEYMTMYVRTKFRDHPELARRLVDTGDAELIEGNAHGDTFWGVDVNTGTGKNWLGIILMLTRSRLVYRANG